MERLLREIKLKELEFEKMKRAKEIEFEKLRKRMERQMTREAEAQGSRLRRMEEELKAKRYNVALTAGAPKRKRKTKESRLPAKKKVRGRAATTLPDDDEESETKSQIDNNRAEKRILPGRSAKTSGVRRMGKLKKDNSSDESSEEEGEGGADEEEDPEEEEEGADDKEEVEGEEEEEGSTKRKDSIGDDVEGETSEEGDGGSGDDDEEDEGGGDGVDEEEEEKEEEAGGGDDGGDNDSDEESDVSKNEAPDSPNMIVEEGSQEEEVEPDTPGRTGEQKCPDKCHDRWSLMVEESNIGYFFQEEKNFYGKKCQGCLRLAGKKKGEPGHCPVTSKFTPRICQTWPKDPTCWFWICNECFAKYVADGSGDVDWKYYRALAKTIGTPDATVAD